MPMTSAIGSKNDEDRFINVTSGCVFDGRWLYMSILQAAEISSVRLRVLCDAIPDDYENNYNMEAMTNSSCRAQGKASARVCPIVPGYARRTLRTTMTGKQKQAADL
jgi:hypothetical protein